MKRILLLISVICLGSSQLSAQQVDSVYLDARASFVQEHLNGNYSSGLRGEYFNFHMWGTITDNLSYRVRQRLTKPADSNNPFRGTEWLSIFWQATPKLRLYAGKTPIFVGSYEYDAATIDVYYYGSFCNNLMQYYAFSANAEYSFAPNQSVVFQIANSPLSDGFHDQYSFNIEWTGRFAPWWNTLWSCNFVENTDRSIINYIALGNRWLLGPVALDLDIINRASFSQKQFFMSDYSFISKVIWSVGKWNICAKGGYEANSAENVNEAGMAYDVAVTPGLKYFYAGCGLEYFPLGNDKLRFHLAYYRDNADHKDNLVLGLKYRMDIYNSSKK